MSPHPVPLYDGVGLPDEPYRYVAPPDGTPTTVRPITVAAKAELASGVTAAYLSLVSPEFGPQVSLGVPQGALAAAAGPVTVTVTPLAPTEEPTGTTIDGNVYRVTLAAPSGPVTVTAKAKEAVIYLRAPTLTPGEGMHYRPAPGKPWQRLKTTKAGNDIWAATFAAAGDYALAVEATGSTSSASGGGRSGLLWGGLLALVVLVLAAVVLVVRRSAGDDEDETADDADDADDAEQP